MPRNPKCARLWFQGKGTRNMAPQVPGLFYTTKMLVLTVRAATQGLDILMQAVVTRLKLLECYHFQHFLRHPPSSARSRCLVGRLQHRAPTCGDRYVGVEGSRWLICPRLLQVHWSVGEKVAPKEEVVDGCFRQE